jgi:hypothetical protein
MAHRYRSHASRTAASALTALSVLVLGCGSVTDSDALETESSASRQRNESPSNSSTPASQGSDSSDDSSDDNAEAAQEGGELEGAAADPEDAEEASDDEMDETESSPARVFAACVTEEDAYEDCVSIYVTMQQTEPPQCIQLTIDNCGTYGGRSLTVDAPARWELTSGSIGTNPSDCELGEFNASNTVLLDASGTIGWDEAAAAPTDLMLELTLEPSRTGGDIPSVDITTSEPLNVAACPD